MAKTRDALSVEHGPARRGLQVRRLFTTKGTHPYDELTWERRDAVITNWRDGTTAFEQRDLEFPSTWSQNATNIVAQKYFRGPLGTPQREHSVRQMVDRVAGTITRWGTKDGYFVDECGLTYRKWAKQLTAQTEELIATYLAGDVLGAWSKFMEQARIVLPALQAQLRLQHREEFRLAMGHATGVLELAAAAALAAAGVACFARGLPRGLFGNSGSMIDHSKSVSSYRRALIQAPPQELESPFAAKGNPVYEFVT